MAAKEQGSANEHKENSTLFSITELMRMEEVRLDEERRARQQRRSQAEAARREEQERERRRREEYERELEAQRCSREAREAEEAAVLAGRILAFVSRAKVEAEAEASLQMQREAHGRELELTRARNDARLFHWRAGFAVLAVTALLGLGALMGTYFGVVAPDHERKVAGLEAHNAERATKMARLERSLEQEAGRRLALEERAVALHARAGEAERRVSALERERATTGRTPPRPETVVTRPPEAIPTSDRCPQGDPMCVERRR